MVARIYKPAKSAMQSGQAGTKSWVLEFAPEEAVTPDPLMGWASSGDMKRQVELRFDTKGEAIAYAMKHGIPHIVIEARERKRNVRPYADNFKYGRIGSWTH